MFQVEISVRFRAAHRLLPPYKGKCNNVHGEGYTAIFIFESTTLDKNGMVIDFGVIKKRIKNWINKTMDHSYLCNKDDKLADKVLKDGYKVCPMDGNPTAELIAYHLYNKFSKPLPKSVRLKTVGIIESFEDSIAWYVA